MRAAPSEKGDGGSTAAQAGPDGRFEFDLDPGEYTFTVAAAGYSKVRQAGSVGASGLDGLRFELPKGPRAPWSNRRRQRAGRLGRPRDSPRRGRPDQVCGSASRWLVRHAEPVRRDLQPLRGDGIGRLCRASRSRAGRGDISLGLRRPGIVRLLVKGPDGRGRRWPPSVTEGASCSLETTLSEPAAKPPERRGAQPPIFLTGSTAVKEAVS